MTKIRITGLDKELARTKLRIGRAIKRSDFAEQLQELTVKEIRDKGLKPELSSSWITARAKLAKFNPTGDGYAAGKSNLTFTGELLDRLSVIFSASKLSFSYRSTGVHKKLKTKNGLAKGPPIKNQDLLEIQNKDRPILQVFAKQEFVKRVEKKLVSAIRRFFK